MIKGSQGLWDSYPIYHHSLFDEVKKTYDLVDRLYTEDLRTPFIAFLKEQFKTEDLWGPLRQNVKDLAHFRHAFHEKADGLRVLQFLKTEQSKMNISDEQSLRENWPLIISTTPPEFLKGVFSFDNMNTNQLQEIREIFFEEEIKLRKNKI